MLPWGVLPALFLFAPGERHVLQAEFSLWCNIWVIQFCVITMEEIVLLRQYHVVFQRGQMVIFLLTLSAIRFLAEYH